MPIIGRLWLDGMDGALPSFSFSPMTSLLVLGNWAWLAYPLTRGSACSFQFQRLSWHLKEQGSVCVCGVHVGLLFLLLLKIFRFKTSVFQYLWKWFGFLWHYPSSVGDDERMRPGCWVIYKPLDFYVFLFAWWDTLNFFIVEATKSHAVSRNTTWFFFRAT